MSKAFTREEDHDDDELEAAPKLPGGKNYITPSGHKKLLDELKFLKHKERPEVTATVAWAAGNGDRSENGDYLYGKKRLREIDRRLRFLNKRLENAEIVDPSKITADQVLFGATVTIRDEEDREKVYSIVGVDEIDLDKGKISWVSPLGSALLKAREGDVVMFRSPRGMKEIEVMKIEFKEIL